MKRLLLVLLPLLAASAAAVGQGPSERRLVCDRGPFGSRTFGGTVWDIYGCNDNRSVAVVTAQGNPGLPFYFLFAENRGRFELSGEGGGQPEVTRRAYDDLSRLTPQEIQALVKETLKAGPRPSQ